MSLCCVAYFMCTVHTRTRQPVWRLGSSGYCVFVFVFKAVLCVDRGIFRAAANAERGAGVVIAAHCHRDLLLWGRWGGHWGGLQAMRPTAPPGPDFPSSHLQCTTVGTILPRMISPEAKRIVWPVAMLSDKTEPQTHRTEWFGYCDRVLRSDSISNCRRRQRDRTTKLVVISDVNHEMCRRESKMCSVTSIVTAVCWRCTKLHEGTPWFRLKKRWWR
jgi:hypothetical protein